MNKKISVNSMVKASMLTGLSIILSRYFGLFITPTMKFSFGSLPLMMAGMMLGPVHGGLAGLVADLIGVMINAGGVPHLGFTLRSILTGMVPGFISAYCRKKGYSLKVEVLLIVIFVFGINHMFLTPLWLSQLYGTPYLVLLATRAPKLLVDAILNYILLYLFASKVMPKIK